MTHDLIAEVLEAAAAMVEKRGREVGGAVNPAITAKAVRGLLEATVAKMLAQFQDSDRPGFTE